MTKDEFNKLPKQERINLAWDKLYGCSTFDRDNPHANVRKRYARLSHEEPWIFVGEETSQNKWIGLTLSKYFFHGLFLGCINDNDKCFTKRINDDLPYQYQTMGNKEIPDDFLEEVYFTEIPAGKRTTEYLDVFDSHVILVPQLVYYKSKEIPMDMHEYVELSKKLGHWATKNDVTTQKLQGVAVGLGDDMDKLVEAYSIAKHNRILKIFWGSVVIIVAIVSLILMC